MFEAAKLVTNENAAHRDLGEKRFRELRDHKTLVAHQ
jgi:hypothetical protein